VLIGEPPRTQYDLNFALFGIPVRIHPLFWLAGVLLGPRDSGAQILLWMVAFFLGVLCHELGHALVMRSQGSFPWITLYGLGGLASCNPSRRAGSKYAETWRDIAVSAAGPLAGFLLAAVALLLGWALRYTIVWQFGAPLGVRLWVIDLANMAQQPLWLDFVNHLLFVTIVYGVLNLLPVYPLDGGQIARELLTMILGATGVRVSLFVSMTVAGCLAIFGAVRLHNPFLTIFFGILAYSSFATLHALGDNRPW
jgi:stage IV sporulation protein FB